MKTAFLFITLSLFSLLACQKSPTSFASIDSDDSAIIEGTRVTSRTTRASQSVVLLELVDANGYGKSFCTGTLVGAHTVLTASHCFDPHLIPGFAKFRVVFTNSFNNMMGSITRDGIYLKTHPKYNSEKQYDHDIALGIFSGNIPEGYAPITMDSDTRANYAGNIVYTYGFGRSRDYIGRRDEDLRASSGDLNKGILRISAPYNRFADRYYVETNSPSHICQGDSGGPQFYNENGVLKVIGVNSAVIGQVLANGMQSCSSYSQGTKVAPHFTWFKGEEQKALARYYH